MPLEAYLTIDDSPSAHTGELTVALRERGVPAILFCRGDRMEYNPEPVIEALRDGFILGNHAYSHTRFSTLSFEQCVDEIERTEKLIEAAHAAAGAARRGKYFRFPHMDRGAGGWIADYDAVPAHRKALIELFTDGLNINLTPPSAEQIDKKKKLQRYLKENGFTAPFPPVALPWYAETEMTTAIDAMFTYSTSDWMITARHAGKWPYKTLEDLKKKIDNDPWLWREDSRHIILTHDHDGNITTTIVLTDHLLDKGFKFLQPGA